MADAFDPRLCILYVKGMLSRDPATIAMNLENFQTLKSELRIRLMELPRQAPSDLEYLDRLDVIEQQLQAVYEKARGNIDAVFF